MPKKKMLKTNGNSIQSFKVSESKIKSTHSDANIDVILLHVSINDDEYSYQIRRDTRAPDLNQIKTHIESSLQRAKEEFLDIEISEYSERNYLFFIVQSIGQQQYTGRRI
ncbi:hypothetical protein MXC99_04170 [Thauera aromatica]|uniref:hypothetical protein n=1 Tax=Thauera aromatica TaxID=59405 RepID=UPI001FFD7AE2|nr:hypothetical protein [Thauera aromatica]MCK2087373.1 hypothetical protein [Thauera aromatica]